MLSRRKLILSALAAPPSRADPARGFDAATTLIAAAVARGEVGAAVLHVSRGRRSWQRAFGRAADPSAVFLLASITKPMTAVGIMALCQSGQLALDQPVATRVPELLTSAVGDREARARLTLRHLLTHTSGLPDMPPGNLELRRRHAPLADFLAAALTLPLGFSPGSRVRYQSMGFLLAAVLAERATGSAFRAHLQRVLCQPLGLHATSLGLGGRAVAQTMTCEVPDDAGGWNSGYWRDLGAPWGGAHGTAADVARLLRFCADPAAGPREARAHLSARTVQTMLTLQTPAGQDRYGLGFRLGAGGAASSALTFGHGGATGGFAWLDPATDLGCVLLTTKPAAAS